MVAFINKISDEQKRKDCFVLIDMMKAASGEEPVLWSNSIVGFGNKRYKSPNTGGKLTGYSLALHRVKQIYRFM